VLSKALREAFLAVEDQWMGIADQKKECSGTTHSTHTHTAHTSRWSSRYVDTRTGTTAAVVVVKDNDIIVGNVGDTEVVVAASGSLPSFYISLSIYVYINLY
jgi:serine/threonine protein phosphatase PrpC